MNRTLLNHDGAPGTDPKNKQTFCTALEASLGAGRAPINH